MRFFLDLKYKIVALIRHNHLSSHQRDIKKMKIQVM